MKIDARLFSPGVTIHGPHLLDVEILQVLRRYVREKVVDVRRAEDALQDFADLPLHRYPHDFMATRIWELRATLTAYDAVYVALAEVLDAPLLSCDRKIALASGHNASVEII
jgi:predicted nucleic acid-binding protein